MPILFIHGVAVRSDDEWPSIRKYLREYVAPAIASDPQNVDLRFVQWYPSGGKFYWDRKSRPLSAILGMGAGAAEGAVARAMELTEVSVDASDAPGVEASVDTGGLVAGGAGPGAAASGPPPRLRDMTPDELSDLFAAVVESTARDETSTLTEAERAEATIAADQAAHDPGTRARLAAQPDADAERTEFEQIVAERLQARTASGLSAHGGTPGWLRDLGDRLGETLQRAVGLPGWAVSRVLGELRRPLNDFITLFFGDVFIYLQEQVDENGGPGKIGRVLLDELKHAARNQKERGGEPIIILSHSMGGQVVYDALTYFMDRDPDLRDVRVDFWCATASQVGLFEELKLFRASDETIGGIPGMTREKVPFPDRKRLGHWWNVWDSNDFISYTGAPIFEGVHDEGFDSGMSLIQAHSGYLQRPSFYRRFAERLRTAKSGNWRRP
jgi:hypothetical protein